MIQSRYILVDIKGRPPSCEGLHESLVDQLFHKGRVGYRIRDMSSGRR